MPSHRHPEVLEAQAHGRRRWYGDTFGVVLVWLLGSALAILVSNAGVAAATLSAAVAAAVALVGFGWPSSKRTAAASALVVAAAVDPAMLLPWTIAIVCLSAIVDDHARVAAEPAMDVLDRDLERCRRRGEPASAFVLELDADARTLRALLRSARITDSVVARRSRRRCEVYGLLHGDIARAKVEARFSEAVDGLTPVFGWASYPVDGLTMDALLEHARTSIATSTDAGGPSLAEVAMARPGLDLAVGFGCDATAEVARS